jgi:LCP family protein required for cell wall assembly
MVKNGIQMKMQKIANRLKQFPLKQTAMILGGAISFFYFLKFIVGVVFLVQVLSFLPGKESFGINILVVGTDEVEGTKRSDAISVIHINKDQTKVRALSIPRDTRVTVEKIGVTKINHAFAHGGISLLKRSVSDLLSIPIHHHIVINASGIERLIDEVGGVSVHIKEPMRYDDYAGNLHINFQPGEQQLDGKDLLKYVRFRSNSKGDIGRIERQQDIATRLFDQMFTLKTLVISPKLLSIFFASVKTDLSLVQISDYLNVFLKNMGQLSIDFLTVPGSVRLIDGVSYWRPDIVYLDNLISKTFVDYGDFETTEIEERKDKKSYITNHQIRRVKQQLALDQNQEIKENRPLKVEVLNGNGIAGLASKTAHYLKNKKMVVVNVSNSQSFNYDDTIIVDWKGNLEKSMRLAKLLNIEPDNIVVYDRQEKPLDITLVLGKNWDIANIEGLNR